MHKKRKLFNCFKQKDIPVFILYEEEHWVWPLLAICIHLHTDDIYFFIIYNTMHEHILKMRQTCLFVCEETDRAWLCATQHGSFAYICIIRIFISPVAQYMKTTYQRRKATWLFLNLWAWPHSKYYTFAILRNDHLKKLFVLYISH